MSSGPSFSTVQQIIDTYVDKVNERGILMGVAIGVVTPDALAGDIFYSTGPVINRDMSPIVLGPTTPFEIGSVSKVFTAGIYENLQGDFSATLGNLLGANMTMSSEVALLTLQQLAAYSSGFPQDNGQCTLHPFQYPTGTLASLASLFGYLKTYDSFPYKSGQTYAYSNLAMSLVAMAALKLNSLDTDGFAAAYNTALVQYCQTFGVDPSGSTPTTLVYSACDTHALPVGYDSTWGAQTGAPCPIVEYGSGGIVSTPLDMLNFLRYCMSNKYPTILQQPVWTLPNYCTAGLSTQTTPGWFIDPTQTDGQTIVSKDGGVPGFSSWIAMNQKNSSGTSTYGVFVLTNGTAAVYLGRQALGLIMGTTSRPAVIDIPERSTGAGEP